MQSSCRQNMRTSVMSIAAYVNDWKETYPFFADPVNYPAFENAGAPHAFGEIPTWWPIAVSRYITEQQLETSVLCPGSLIIAGLRREGLQALLAQQASGFNFGSDYSYSLSFVTDKSIWNASQPYWELGIRRPVRIGEVAFPSSKGLLIEDDVYHDLAGDDSESRKQIMFLYSTKFASLIPSTGYCDGSVESRRVSDFVPSLSARYRPEGFPVLMTIDGYAGHDR